MEKQTDEQTKQKTRRNVIRTTIFLEKHISSTQDFKQKSNSSKRPKVIMFEN